MSHVQKCGTLVDDSSNEHFNAGWLFGFDINRDRLKHAHMRWLDQAVVAPIKKMDAMWKRRMKCDDSLWKIWIVGAASRTGSAGYNQRLSKKRGASVEKYLKSKLRGVQVPWKTDIVASGESTAMYRGSKDEVENLLDRAVLVVATPEGNSQKYVRPPVVPRPKRATNVEVEFRFCADRSTLMNVDTWYGSLYAKCNGPDGYELSYWPVFGRGVSADPSLISKAYTPPGYGDSNVLTDWQKIQYPNIYGLENINNKYVSLGLRPKKMTMSIKKAKPNGNDIDLTFGATVGIEIAQTYYAKTGKRKSLTWDEYRRLFRGARVENGKRVFLA
jgi:outer membrane protein OmpA-like peptidoglycan-associated protein